jgi:hypothetical protein
MAISALNCSSAIGEVSCSSNISVPPFYDESRRLAQHRSPVAEYRQQNTGGFSGERAGTLPLHPQCQECQQASLRIPSRVSECKLFGFRTAENVIGNLKGKSNLAGRSPRTH